MKQDAITDITVVVSSFVSEYEVCVRKSTASILELADCVFRAKTQLSEKAYEEFCEKIKVDKKSSYLKKLNCIAQSASRFKLVETQLPANYTTLYALTKVSDSNFDKMCNENVINPMMTAKQLNAYLDKDIVAKPAVYEVMFKLDSKTDLKDILECMNVFDAVASKFKIELKKSPDLISALEQESNKKAVIDTAVCAAVNDSEFKEAVAA